jgi:hypothetical protein
MKTCIFCKSEEEITKEHIFNKWYRELNEIPLSSLDHLSYKHNSKRIVGGEDFKDVVIEKKSYREHSINTLVNGSVCRKCNILFLNSIDEKAKGVVTKILKSKAKNFPMSQEDCTNLAMWAYKTVLTLTNTKTINYRKLIPNEAYEDFYLTKRVPEDVVISLARLNKSSYKSEPFWLISQNFMFEFTQDSKYLQQVLIEDKYLINPKKTYPPEVYYLMKKCTEESFHVILNLNGTLIRIAYTPRTDLLKYNFTEKEAIINPKIIGYPDNMLTYETMFAFWQNLKLEYKGFT